MTRNRLVLLVILAASMLMLACEQKPKEVPQNTAIYDSLKAQQYGADDWGMRRYVIAFLKRGPNRDLPEEEARELQAAHMKNIGDMADAGKLAVAGPFLGNDDLRGIYIFNVETIEEAEALTNTDPAIQAGSLVMELKEWYGSAALMAVPEIHDSITKEKF